MNSDTGHLVDLLRRPELAKDPNYRPVPQELHEAALAKLAGEADAFVRLRGDGELSTYRRSERRRAERAAQKAAKRSRP